jgi:CheY-like chemotaxis protein
MSGFDLLRKAKEVLNKDLPPVIIYTGKELTQDEYEELCLYTTSVVIKSAESPERLLDEVTLFLHSVESSLPSYQQKMIRLLHDTDSSLNNKKVLIVDDDMRNVYALSAALQAKGINVTAVTSGKKAEIKIKEIDDFDIVLMDIMMPEQDGYETIENIRKNKKNNDLPIIAVTAKAMIGDKEKCLNVGANDYLAKPVDIDKLIALLKIWLL